MIAAIALSISANCQSPLLMSYQSVIRNSSGDLINNGNVGFRISILQGSISGSVVYTETHSVTTNSNGLATLNIGGGTPFLGSILGINWENGPYFIKTDTDPTGGTNYTLSGTSQLLSVPYALYAAKSGSNSPWSIDATGIFYNTGKVAIGSPTSNPANSSASLTLNGAFDHYSDNSFQTVQRFRNTSNDQEYQLNLAGSNNIDFANRSFGIYNATLNRWVMNTEGSTNNLGVGSYTYKQAIPKSRLHVFDGDVNINDIGKGIILKSANGQCWRFTASDNGSLISTSIACP